MVGLNRLDVRKFREFGDGGVKKNKTPRRDQKNMSHRAECMFFR